MALASRVGAFFLVTVLYILSGLHFVVRSQTPDSVLLYRKLLGSDDLILHADSFKTKVVAVSRSEKNIEDQEE